MGPEQLSIAALARRVNNGGGVKELILATNSSVEGEATAHYVERMVGSQGVEISRLARGLPVGSELEYADGETIAQALSARRPSTQQPATDNSRRGVAAPVQTGEDKVSSSGSAKTSGKTESGMNDTSGSDSGGSNAGGSGSR